MIIIVLLVVSILALALVALWLFGERGHLMLPSTRRSVPRRGGKQSGARAEPHPAKPAQRNAALDALHGYVYGRWTNQYISIALNWLMPRLNAEQREHWANSYHGKVLTPELAAELVMLDHDVNARNLEQIIPYPVARDVILRSPVAVTLYECACRHARADGGCKPTDVCMIIGSGGDFALDHNPQSARRITQAEALNILRAEHERGHLHSAWFKDVMGDRLYAICNCCKCCCGGIEAMTRYGIRTMASSGYVAAIDEASCTACGLCVDHCPFDALTLEGALASVNSSKCMGCGVCQSQCAFEAIALLRDETKPAPLDVRVLA
jgi:ferredoxin